MLTEEQIEDCLKYARVNKLPGMFVTIVADLRALRSDLEKIMKDRSAALNEIKRLKRENADFLKMTENLDEHPEDYDGPCHCALCMSYAD